MANLTQPELDRLNQAALRVQRAHPEYGVVQSLEQAARDANLTEWGREGNCILYGTPDGRHVNCWMEGQMSQAIQEGGAGFDDQTDLWVG